MALGNEELLKMAHGNEALLIGATIFLSW